MRQIVIHAFGDMEQKKARGLSRRETRIANLPPHRGDMALTRHGERHTIHAISLPMPCRPVAGVDGNTQERGESRNEIVCDDFGVRLACGGARG
jgi:hypothetical protein